MLRLPLVRIGKRLLLCLASRIERINELSSQRCIYRIEKVQGNSSPTESIYNRRQNQNRDNQRVSITITTEEENQMKKLYTSFHRAILLLSGERNADKPIRKTVKKAE